MKPHIYEPENLVCVARFKRLLETEGGRAANNALQRIKALAAQRNADPVGFDNLLYFGMEEILSRRNLRKGSEPELKLEVSNIESRIRRLEKVRDEQFPIDPYIPLEMISDSPALVLNLEGRNVIDRKVTLLKQQLRWAQRRLAAHYSQRKKYAVRDTFAIARLRTALFMFTGATHDADLPRILNLFSTAANKDADWTAGVLQKATERFSNEYEGELPALLLDAACLMGLQVYPWDEDSAWEERLRVVSFILRICKRRVTFDK